MKWKEKMKIYLLAFVKTTFLVTSKKWRHVKLQKVNHLELTGGFFFCTKSQLRLVAQEWGRRNRSYLQYETIIRATALAVCLTCKIKKKNELNSMCGYETVEREGHTRTHTPFTLQNNNRHACSNSHMRGLFLSEGKQKQYLVSGLMFAAHKHHFSQQGRVRRLFNTVSLRNS